MPSGARKRKAAKKNQKKLKPTTPSSASLSSTTSFAHGDEDLKHHESDGGHNTTDVDNGVEKSTDMKNGNAQMEKGAGQDDGGVQDEGNSGPGNGFNQKNGDSPSSGTNSDSDGSGEVEEKITISENAPVIDLVEAVISASEGPVEATHTTLVTKESARLDEVRKELAPANHKDEENACLPEVSKELETEDKKNYIVDEAATSEGAVDKNEEKMVLLYNATRVDAKDDAKDVKGSKVLGTVDIQASVTFVVRPEKATSWKSCCGLFEAFTGVDR
ncbi:hypothetical protein LIER_08674 [Lithospermum erythrorhizon]|uniref:Uncharacterized protein n=1 Tax=Lithospermum erythrorhizon TaxID=34254 RepID=A0AAV3PH93_LITER